MSTSLSSFPSSVDIFERYSDLTAKTMEKAEIYKGYIEAGEYATAEQYLNAEENEDLKICGISAEIINKHSDAIIALENQALTNKGNISQQATRIDKLMVGQLVVAKDEDATTNTMGGTDTGGIVCFNYVVDNTVISSVALTRNNTEAGIEIKRGYPGSATLAVSRETINKLHTKGDSIVGSYMDAQLYQKVIVKSVSDQYTELNLGTDITNIVDISGTAKQYNTTTGIYTYYPLSEFKINVQSNNTTGYFLNINTTSASLSTPIEFRIILKYTK